MWIRVDDRMGYDVRLFSSSNAVDLDHDLRWISGGKTTGLDDGLRWESTVVILDLGGVMNCRI